ncbi:hypothetical protein EON67_02465 [archaeon]|nr:MAG: hypothetical protein EON67_02465 [archaeon]
MQQQAEISPDAMLATQQAVRSALAAAAGSGAGPSAEDRRLAMRTALMSKLKSDVLHASPTP